MTEGVAVTIAVCTYRRPILLGLLLRDLEQQRFEKVPTVDVSILVIDNDAEGAAQAVVLELQTSVRFPVRYVVQPQRGLAAVRNTALEFANGQDYLAFVDDDERVAPNWLDELIFLGLKLNSAFVIGPVRPVFPEGCPEFYITSQLYHRKEHCDGASIREGNTGNALICMKFVRSHNVSFRQEFNRSGGEDTCFFAEIAKKGGRGVYALQAVANEPVSTERLAIRWLLRRRCRFGATEVVNASIQRDSAQFRRLKYVALGIARIIGASVMVLALGVFSKGRALRYACAGARGAGYVIGAMGKNIAEY